MQDRNIFAGIGKKRRAILDKFIGEELPMVKGVGDSGNCGEAGHQNRYSVEAEVHPRRGGLKKPEVPIVRKVAGVIADGGDLSEG